VNYERKIRGKKFLVEINNYGTNQTAIKKVLVNGAMIEGNFINPANYREEIIRIKILV
jgi:hypothetical protein